MERHVMSDLEKWKDDKTHNPLIIRGTRQVGKTWLMRKFGELYFKKKQLILSLKK